MKRQTFFRTSLIGLLFFLSFNLFAKLNNYPVPDRDTVPAFPGAEGAGKFTSEAPEDKFISLTNWTTTDRKEPLGGLWSRKEDERWFLP